MLISVKLAPCFPYSQLEQFWRTADDLGFHAVWNYDHFYGLVDFDTQTLEGWTTLAAMSLIVKNIRVGCMVSGVTYRHPALLANMAVSVDHISGGRLDFGLGAAWHEGEHIGYGIPFPRAPERIQMLDEALTVIKLLWTEDRANFHGNYYHLEDARCYPKPVQKPHPPIVVGAMGPKLSMRVAAKHADEWNAARIEPDEWGKLNGIFDQHCADLGRDPSAIRRSVQLFLFPDQDGQTESEFAKLPAYADQGCQHAVLSFYAPPSPQMLEDLAKRLH